MNGPETERAGAVEGGVTRRADLIEAGKAAYAAGAWPLLIAGLAMLAAARGSWWAVAGGVERGATGWLCRHAMWMEPSWAQVVGCSVAIAAGGAVYFGLAKALRFPELGFVTEALARRKRKKAAAA